MSQFADYERASNNYDNGRTAAGADIIAGMLRTHLNKNLKVFITIFSMNQSNVIFYSNILKVKIISLAFRGILIKITDMITTAKRSVLFKR